MGMVIVAAIVAVALGAFATFTLADLISPEVAAKAEEHGRFAGLGDQTEREAASCEPNLETGTRRPERNRHRVPARVLCRRDKTAVR